jgi:alkylation response protein AidB-like acyl-CoA dehydrogenase
VDFSLSPEQRELTEAAAEFARKELNHDLAKREDAGEFPRDAWRACAKFGILGLPVPWSWRPAGTAARTTGCCSR